MPVATIETKSGKIDDDLTDLSWLIQMNNHKKQRHSTSNENIERLNKPFAVVNCQPIRSAIPTYTHNHQYYNDENQFYSHQSFPNEPMKRKFDSSFSYHQTKRFHSEQTLPIYPPSESYYSNHPPCLTQQQQQQHRTPIPTTSRYMLYKNDPSLSDTIPTVHMPTNLHEQSKLIDHEKIYSDDIEHLLDIFKNEVEMIGLDPIATTSTGDCALDLGHCLSSNEFCPY